jgi:O-antigen ligase
MQTSSHYVSIFDRITGILFAILLVAAAMCAIPSLRFHGLATMGVVTISIAVLYLCRFLSPSCHPRQPHPFSRYLLCFCLMLFPSALAGLAPIRSLIISTVAVSGFFAFFAVREAFLAAPKGVLSRTGFAGTLATACTLAVLFRFGAHVAGKSGSFLPWYCLAPPDIVAGQPFDRIFSFMLVCALPFIVLGAYKTTQWKRTFFEVSTAFTGLGILLSFSRAAWVAVATQTLLLAVMNRSIRRWIPILAIGAVVIGLLIPAIAVRGRSLASLQEGSNSVRLEYWGAGIELVSQSPFLGYGLGTFADAYLELKGAARPGMVPSPHNLLLRIAVECGIPGLCIFIGCVFGVLRQLMLQPKQNRDYGCEQADENGFPQAGGIALVGLLVFSLFHM